jgi:Domain of unknown function (DU1801)
MPAYVLDGQAEVAFAKQVQYLSLYIIKKKVLDAHRLELRGVSTGKGCIRFKRPDQIDWALVGNLLRETAKSNDQPC